MKIDEWYAARDAEAKRWETWSEKIGTLLGPEIDAFIEGSTPKSDPVTGADLLRVVKYSGPRELLAGCRVSLFDENLVEFKVSKRADSMRVEPVEDLYPGMVIVDITGNPGQATLNYVDPSIKLPAFKSVPLGRFLSVVLERRLGAFYPNPRGIRLA